MLTYMEGAEFNTGVDNLWALIITHHAQLNLKRNDGYPLLQCENPRPPHTSLFPDYLFQGLSAHSLEPGNGRPFYTASSIPLISALLCERDFSLRVIPLTPCHSEFSHKTTKRWKTLTTHQPPRKWSGTTVSVSMHIFKFGLALPKKNKSSIRRKHHCRDLLGTRYIWNRWLSFPSPTLL